MNKSIITLVTGLALVVGCSQQSPPGGPGANKQPPVVGQGENTFKIAVPAMETSVAQGETKSVTVSLNRGKNFNKDVLIDIVDLPKGVSVTPLTASMKGGDSDKVQVDIAVAKDAPVGHHTLTVWGNPGADNGAKTSVPLKIEVKTP